MSNADGDGLNAISRLCFNPCYNPPMMSSPSSSLTSGSELRAALQPGMSVLITQQIPHRDHTWTNQVRGTVVSYEQQPTGSWYAHGKDDKLWLDRLVLRKADGEIVSLNLDEYSKVEVAK